MKIVAHLAWLPAVLLVVGCGSSDPQPAAEPAPVKKVETNDNDKRFDVNETSPKSADGDIMAVPSGIVTTFGDAFDGQDKQGKQTRSGRILGSVWGALGNALAEGDAEETMPSSDRSEAPAETGEPAEAETSTTDDTPLQETPEPSVPADE